MYLKKEEKHYKNRIISGKVAAAASQHTREGEYWLARFQGNPVKTSFPYDYEPSATDNPNPGAAADTKTFKFQLTGELFERIMKLSNGSDAKLFMIITAGLSILLHHYTGRSDIIVGTPILKQDIEGEFINTVLALRNQIEDHMTFKEVLVQVRQTVIDAFENQNYPIETLLYNLDIPSAGSGFPLFDTVVLLENIQKRSYIESIRRNMTFSSIRKSHSIDVAIEYNPALYKKQTPQRIAGYFTQLLKQTLRNAHLAVSDIDIIPEEDKTKILNGFNATDVEYPETKTVYQLFDTQVEKTPDMTAVVGNGTPDKVIQQLTYKELKEKSNQLARILWKKGVTPDIIVGIMMPPSLEMIIGILGILKAGGAYLPIDPDYPPERVNYMLADSRARVLVSELSEMSKLSKGIEIVRPNELDEGLPTHPTHLTHPTQLCYILYTSGTTGNPKGVLVENRNLVNYVTWFSSVTRLTCDNRTVLTSSFAFDLGYTSIYPAILKGGELHVLPREIYLDSPLFLDYLRKHQISYIKATPSFFSLIVNHPGFSMGARAVLRLAVLGGEPINIRDIEKAHSLCPHLKIMNHYGPTETTIGTVAQFIDFDRFEEYKTNPTVGKPIYNTKAYVLDSILKVLPLGSRGELCISGDSLARGYLNDPRLTAGKFTKNPYEKGKRLFKIGDLARWLENGNIEFLGRIDHQVKVRGFRIELEEIESQLRKHKDVNEAVVMLKNDVNCNQFLCAFITAESSNTTAAASQLRKFLSGILPDYMIPSYFIPVAKMPLTPNGKIDRKKLPEPIEKQGVLGLDSSIYVPPGDDVEKKLMEIWAEILAGKETLETIGIDDDFFQLGGHSLNATILISRIREELKVNVPLGELFRAPTIRMLAVFIRNPGIDAFTFKDDNLVLLKNGTDREKHLFFVHAGSGEVEGYMEFCHHLDPDFNYWGIRADRLKNRSPRKLINEQVTAAYLEKVKKVQPRGPYYIAGWCIGGTIAFEMVNQLEQSKEDVGFFALINAIAPQKDYLWMDSSEFTLEQELNWITEKFPEGETKEKLKNIADVHKIWPLIIDYLETSGWDKNTILDLYARAATNVREFSKTAIPNYNRLTIKELIYYCNVIRTYRNVRASYIPDKKINTPTHYFEASRHKISNKNLWSNYCSKPIAFYEVEGDHFSIFEIPETLEFAKLFNRVFEAEKRSKYE
jgi:fengycin family lipopeptide synthetase D